MKKEKFIEQATKLRKRGYSYDRIAEQFKVAKSTSHLWLKNVPISTRAKERLIKNSHLGRLKGFETNRRKRLERNFRAFASAQETASAIKSNLAIIKSFCALLYWAEGSKSDRGVNFVNSDPNMIKMFLQLLRQGFTIKEDKLRAMLHLHPYHNITKQIAFWSEVTAIPKNHISVYNKVNSGKNIRINYPGCISIRYCDVNIFNEIRYLYQILASKNYKVVGA